MRTAPYDTPAGTRLRFAFPKNGYRQDQQWAAQRLTVGAVYTLERSEIFDNSTDFFLVELPGCPFNSVMFALEDTAAERRRADQFGRGGFDRAGTHDRFDQGGGE